jgi:hypothetical protein
MKSQVEGRGYECGKEKPLNEENKLNLNTFSAG